jgi:predicted DNA-binding protein YlxM (UPF0122 family)
MVKLNKKKFRESLKGSGGNITLLAERLQVTRKAVYEFINKHEDIQEELESEKWKIQETAEVMLRKKISEGDMQAINTALVKHKRGREMGYGEKQEIEHSTAPEGITINLITKSDEEIRNDK